eukprot:scaffold5049_cov112-Isochrysis_galbana.AAC.3
MPRAVARACFSCSHIEKCTGESDSREQMSDWFTLRSTMARCTSAMSSLFVFVGGGRQVISSCPPVSDSVTVLVVPSVGSGSAAQAFGAVSLPPPGVIAEKLAEAVASSITSDAFPPRLDTSPGSGSAQDPLEESIARGRGGAGSGMGRWGVLYLFVAVHMKREER